MLVRESIEQFTDMGAVLENKEQELEDEEVISQLKEDALEYVEQRAHKLGLG